MDIRYPVIVAAAGGSSRCPEGKLLKSWQGKPLLAWLLERLSAHPGLGSLLVVTGHQREKVEALAADYPGARTVHNPDWRQGLSSTLKKGESQLARGHGFLVALGDTPLFQAETLERLLPPERCREIRLPTYQGRFGHPAFFPEWVRLRWGLMSGDQGAKSLIRRWARYVVEIPVDDPGILRDFDRSEDFQEQTR